MPTEVEFVLDAIGLVIQVIWAAHPLLVLPLALVVAATLWEPIKWVAEVSSEVRDTRARRRRLRAEALADRELDAEITELLTVEAA